MAKLGVVPWQKIFFYLKNKQHPKIIEIDNKINDKLDEWIYFLKNDEIKPTFSAKGLKEANEVLDIMRLPKADEYGYNRYLDSLHLKASEIFTLRTEAEFNVEERKATEIAKNAISEGLNDELISKLTKLPIERIVELRNELKK